MGGSHQATMKPGKQLWECNCFPAGLDPSPWGVSHELLRPLGAIPIIASNQTCQSKVNFVLLNLSNVEWPV